MDETNATDFRKSDAPSHRSSAQEEPELIGCADCYPPTSALLLWVRSGNQVTRWQDQVLLRRSQLSEDLNKLFKLSC